MWLAFSCNISDEYVVSMSILFKDCRRFTRWKRSFRRDAFKKKMKQPVLVNRNLTQWNRVQHSFEHLVLARVLDLNPYNYFPCQPLPRVNELWSVRYISSFFLIVYFAKPFRHFPSLSFLNTEDNRDVETWCWCSVVRSYEESACWAGIWLSQILAQPESCYTSSVGGLHFCDVQQNRQQRPLPQMTGQVTWSSLREHPDGY